jgi:hypothetical protein
LPNRSDNAPSVPANNLGGCILDGGRNPFSSPFPNANYWATDATRELQLKVNPFAVSRVHSGYDEKNVRGTHLIAEFIGEPAARDRIMLRNTKVFPTEVRRFIQEMNDAPIVLVIAPNVADCERVTSCAVRYWVSALAAADRSAGDDEGSESTRAAREATDLLVCFDIASSGYEATRIDRKTEDKPQEYFWVEVSGPSAVSRATH